MLDADFKAAPFEVLHGLFLSTRAISPGFRSVPSYLIIPKGFPLFEGSFDFLSGSNGASWRHSQTGVLAYILISVRPPMYNQASR